MPISPHLLRKLQDVLGADAADGLVSQMESVEAIRGDLGELRHEMQLGFARIDARFQQVDARFEQVDRRFQQVEERFGQQDARWLGLFETRYATNGIALGEGPSRADPVFLRRLVSIAGGARRPLRALGKSGGRAERELR